MTYHIIGRTHPDDEIGPRYTLMIDGEQFSNVNRFVLASLEDGMTPSELGMDPDDESRGGPDEDCTTLVRYRGWR
jgi:hypothetical protein